MSLSTVAPRTGIAAARSGRTQIHHPTRSWDNDCAQFVRWQCFGAPGGWDYRTAWYAWLNNPSKHRDDPSDAPYGVPGFFRGPGSAGHTVFMLDGGRCLSNDVLRDGDIDVTSVRYILDAWPGAEWVGWAEHCNGMRVWGHGPSFSADAVRRSQRGDHEHRHGALLKRELAAAVGRHGMNLKTDQVGAPMGDAVKALQRQLGFKPTGLVGPSVLAYLADRRYAFTARP